MSSDKTVVMKWHYTTPCGQCGRDIKVAPDPSNGKQKFNGAPTVTLKCEDCGHQGSYPASAVDNKKLSA